MDCQGRNALDGGFSLHKINQKAFLHLEGGLGRWKNAELFWLDHVLNIDIFNRPIKTFVTITCLFVQCVLVSFLMCLNHGLFSNAFGSVSGFRRAYEQLWWSIFAVVLILSDHFRKAHCPEQKKHDIGREVFLMMFMFILDVSCFPSEKPHLGC